MGSNAGWKVEGPRENIAILTKGFKKSSIALQKIEGAMPPPPFVGGSGDCAHVAVSWSFP